MLPIQWCVANHRVPLEGVYEFLNYCITVDFFKNYSNTVIKFLCKYNHRSTSYQKSYFTVSSRWPNYRILTIFYSNYGNTIQQLVNTEYRHTEKWGLNSPSFTLAATLVMKRLFSLLKSESIHQIIFSWFWPKCDVAPTLL